MVKKLFLTALMLLIAVSAWAIDLTDYHPRVRYFALSPEHVKGHVSELVPDNDFLPLDVFQNSLQCGVTDDGRIIVSVLLSNETLQSIAENTGQVELNQAVLDSLQINASFAGRTYADVIAKFPEMAQIIYTMEGENEIATPRLNRKGWKLEYEVQE